MTTTPESAAAAAAEMGYGAVKYFDLRQHPSTSYVFRYGLRGRYGCMRMRVFAPPSCARPIGVPVGICFACFCLFCCLGLHMFHGKRGDTHQHALAISFMRKFVHKPANPTGIVA